MKKILIIASAVISILVIVYMAWASFNDHPFDGTAIEHIALLMILLLITLTPLQILFNIKQTSFLKISLLLISLITVIYFSAGPSYMFFRIIFDRAYYNMPSLIIRCIGAAAIAMSCSVYIIRTLKLSNTVLLIVFGLACALVSAAGIMWYNNPDDPTIAARRQLHHTYFHTRGLAIYKLGRLGDVKSIPEIRKLLNDKNYFVLEQTIEALGKLGDKESIPQIRDMLKVKDYRISSAALDALGILGDKKSIPDIRNFISDDMPQLSYDPHHLKAIDSLVKMNDRESIPRIQKLLYNGNCNIRNQAIKALAEFGDKESIPRIKELLNDRDNRNVIRKTAEEALKKLGVPEEEIERAKSK